MTEKERYIEKVFNKTFNGQKNAFTPVVYKYGEAENCFYEISCGQSIFNKNFYRGPEGLEGKKKMWGITFLTKKGERIRKLDRGGFSSLQEAEKYLEEVTNQVQAQQIQSICENNTEHDIHNTNTPKR